MTYRERMVECETCCGTGTTIEFRRYAGEYQAGEPVEVECEDCTGEGEWPAECAECHEARPLNDDGMCSECLMLTEVEADPLSRRVA